MFLSRIAPTLLSRVQWLCQWKNVKLCQEDIASLFLSRGPGWSPRMCLGRCVSLLVVMEELVDLVEQEELVELEVAVDSMELVDLEMVGDLVVLAVLEVQVVLEENMEQEVDMAVEVVVVLVVLVVLVLADLQIIGTMILAMSPKYTNEKLTTLKQLNKSWNPKHLMMSFLFLKMTMIGK